jgi:hypothetical protein
MITPYTERQKSMIVSNVIKAVKDPAKLSKQAYKYLYLCSGFIAHYDHGGFISYYQRNNLKADILRFRDCNRWNNVTSVFQDYEYYQSKADIYNRIIQSIGA